MPERGWEEHLIGGLRRRSCPEEQMERLLREMTDHHADLIAERVESGLSEPEAKAYADGRLGSAEQIAGQLVQMRQGSDWWGRHPRLLFGAAPLVVFILGVAGSTLLLALVGDFHGWWSQPSTLSEGTWIKLTLLVPAVHFALVTAIPFLACRLTSYYCYGWRWALAACLILAVHAYLHSFEVDFPLLSERGRMAWGYSISTRLTGNLWTALPPLLVFLHYYLRTHLKLRGTFSRNSDQPSSDIIHEN